VGDHGKPRGYRDPKALAVAQEFNRALLGKEGEGWTSQEEIPDPTYVQYKRAKAMAHRLRTV
jgi:hypothetical protein